MRWKDRGSIPTIYAILDGDTLRRCGVDLRNAATSLREAGAGLVQYREKTLSRERVRENATAVAEIFRGSGAVLLLNDYADEVVRCGFDGVHLGQGDVPVREARALLGRWAVIGVSTHDAEEVRVADQDDVDYVAIGPVFPTASKRDAEGVVGLEGVRAARALTGKPLVAIGGINAGNGRAVRDAGADAVAVIGALTGAGAEIGARWEALWQAVREEWS